MKHIFSMLVLVLLSLVMIGPAMSDDVKERMTARLPVINSLKAEGIIGENNKGYLEFRSSKRVNTDVIDAENNDRSEVYQSIATRQQASAEFVGQARAAQIADKEPSGFWVQKADGRWIKK